MKEFIKLIFLACVSAFVVFIPLGFYAIVPDQRMAYLPTLLWTTAALCVMCFLMFMLLGLLMWLTDKD